MTRNKKLLGAKGIATRTRSKDATRAPGLTTRNKKLLGLLFLLPPNGVLSYLNLTLTWLTKGRLRCIAFVLLICCGFNFFCLFWVGGSFSCSFRVVRTVGLLSFIYIYIHILLSTAYLISQEPKQKP